MSLRRRIAAILLGCIVVASALMTATGFGAVSSGTSDVAVGTTVDAVISVTLPPAGAIDAGTTQPSIVGVGWDGSTLSLGEIGLGDLTTAGLTYTVFTNNPTGYQVVLEDPSGVAPVLSDGAVTFPDYSATPSTISAGAVTGFGVTVDGDATTDPLLDAQWGAGGTLFRNVPQSPANVPVASRPVASDAAGDLYQVIYSANVKTDDVYQDDGAFTGQVNMVATTL